MKSQLFIKVVELLELAREFFLNSLDKDNEFTLIRRPYHTGVFEERDYDSLQKYEQLISNNDAEGCSTTSCYSVECFVSFARAIVLD